MEYKQNIIFFFSHAAFLAHSCMCVCVCRMHTPCNNNDIMSSVCLAGVRCGHGDDGWCFTLAHLMTHMMMDNVVTIVPISAMMRH
jgi:hypothetical protein